MQRLYVVPLTVLRSTHTFSSGASVRYVDIFHPRTGSHHIGLGNGLVLVSIDFDSEMAEDIWHSHPDVGILPHPLFEGNMPLSDAVANPAKKFYQDHLEALAAIAVQPEHTVLDVHTRAKDIHPLVRVRPLV